MRPRTAAWILGGCALTVVALLVWGYVALGDRWVLR